MNAIDLKSQLESEKDINILLISQTGSRAYGLNRDDSDTDLGVVFSYKNAASYINPFRVSKNNFEFKIENCDVKMWDITKIARLIIESNPTVYEWFYSPKIYYADRDWLASARELYDHHFCFRRLTKAYLGNFRQHRAKFEKTNDNKYFSFKFSQGIVLTSQRK